MSGTFSYDVKTKENEPLFEFNSAYSPRVSYHFNSKVSHYHYGVKHPMKPFRLMLTDHLVSSYGLHKIMDLYETRSATRDELLQFHSEDYVNFLSKVSPENANKLPRGTLEILTLETTVLFFKIYMIIQHYTLVRALTPPGN